MSASVSECVSELKHQTQDANCVTPVSAPSVSKYMRAQDLAEGSSRTTTGTTSSLTQTVVREAAAKSLRAVVCYVSTMLYAGYNPIDSNHPRYLKHKLTMNDTDRLVESGTKCAMLPVDNHLLTSQDATTTYVHLNAQPSKTDVGQRKANLAQPGSAGHRRGASGALSRRNGAAICSNGDATGRAASWHTRDGLGPGPAAEEPTGGARNSK